MQAQGGDLLLNEAINHTLPKFDTGKIMASLKENIAAL